MIPYRINFENGTTTQRAQVIAALELAHAKMATNEFRLAVLDHKMPDGSKGFYQAGMSNQEVYDKLMSTPWAYSVSFYSKRLTSARAYVNPGDPTVNLNWYKMGGENPRYTANTLVHENTHLKGFSHDFEASYIRDFTVPYGVGQIIEDLLAGVKPSQPAPQPVKYYTPWYKKILPWNWF